MPTYFGYVEREADNFVNWAEVGKGLSDTINEIGKIREEKKAALDESAKEFGRKLSEYPTGQNIDANKFAYNFSDNASQYMLMQQRLLKQGKLKMKDYLTNTQNLMDDTDNAFGMVKAYQEMYGKKMDQYKNKEISIGEVDNFAFIEKFGNFGNVDLYINPLDGSVSVAKMVEKDIDGKKIRTMDTNPDNIMSVGAMKQLMNTPIPRYDMEKNSSALAEGMGTQIDIMQKDGMIISYENIRRRLYGRGIINSNDQDKITDALINSDINLGGLSLTKTEKKKNEKGEEVEVKSAITFDNEYDLTAKYLEIKQKGENEMTSEEKNLLFQVEKSIAGDSKDRKMIESYEEAENAMIRSNLGTDYNYMSALMDNNVICSDNKKPYQGFTFDKEVAAKNPQMILKEIVNGTVEYKLTAKQKKDAEDAMREQIRMKLEEKKEFKGTYKTPEQLRQESEIAKRKLDIEEKRAKKGRAPSEAEIKAYGNARRSGDEANYIADLYYSSDPRRIERAITHYESKDHIYKVNRTANGIELTYATIENGEKVPTDKKTFPFYTSTNKPLGTDLFYESIFDALMSEEENKRLDRAEGKKYIQERQEKPEMSTFPKLDELRKEYNDMPESTMYERIAKAGVAEQIKKMEEDIKTRGGQTSSTTTTTIIPRPK